MEITKERINKMKYNAAVITISDKGAKGERIDTSGPALCEILKDKGYDVVYTNIIPDEKTIIEQELVKCSDELKIALVLTTGGTGFSPRDITPEATRSIIERETPGIAEAMRLESLKITPKGCLSRSVSGIRKQTLIINLPGSKKASCENLNAVLGALDHGLDMLYSAGSADCAQDSKPKKVLPSMDQWLKEAKKDQNADKVGMYLTHNGIVRKTAKSLVREGDLNAKEVTGMLFSYDEAKVNEVIVQAKQLPGIYYVRVWLNEGQLNVGDDIMYVLIGGDIRPNVVNALDFLVGSIKKECVHEQEMY